jgi:hypothetical protein
MVAIGRVGEAFRTERKDPYSGALGAKIGAACIRTAQARFVSGALHTFSRQALRKITFKSHATTKISKCERSENKNNEGNNIYPVFVDSAW